MGGPILGIRERLAVDRILRSGQLAQGSEVSAFESGFSRLVANGKKVIAVNSGTSALHIGNLALGIGPGDEVLVPAFTFAASANSIALTGATPVFCDIDRQTFTIDVDSMKANITSRTKAVMAVHLYGQMADMNAITKLAKEHNLLVIEDAAQAHGASLGGLVAGEWGDYAAFSFYPTKNMTTGEGGAIVTGNPEVERSARLLRNQGMIERYRNEVIGLNNRMTNISAAIGNVQLKRLPDFTRRRQKNAEFYLRELSDLVELKLPRARAGGVHVYHQFTITVQGDRDKLANELRAQGVESGLYYPKPVNDLEAYKVAADVPNANWVANHCLSLPIHPGLSKRDLGHVVRSIKKVLAK